MMEKKTVLIEDVLAINKELSFFHLITKRATTKYKFFMAVSFTMLLGVAVWANLTQKIEYVLLTFLLFFVLYFFQKYAIKDVFKRHYPNELYIDGNWDNRTIINKQKDKLAEKLCALGVSNKETVYFLYKAIQRKYDSSRNNFSISVLSGVILSATVGSWFALIIGLIIKDVGEHDYEQLFKYYSIICAFIFVCTLATEQLLIRSIKIYYKKQQDTILDALENIYFDLCLQESKSGLIDNLKNKIDYIFQ